MPTYRSWKDAASIAATASFPIPGAPKYRAVYEDVLIEIAGLAQQGVKEITLLGQNVNAYRGEMEDGTIADFAMLIEYMAEIPGIERIRFVTSHPREFTQRLIDVYENVPQLVSHLYLPAQHGSDRILAAMKRGYTALEYKSIIRRLKAIRPDLLVSSDFIVGFPGETDADFDAMMKLIDDIGFDNSFSFLYSPRPGTPAAALPMDIPLDVRKNRLQRLQEKIDGNTRHYNRMMVGSVQKVLIEAVFAQKRFAGTGQDRQQPGCPHSGGRRSATHDRPDERRAHHRSRPISRCVANSPTKLLHDPAVSVRKTDRPFVEETAKRKCRHEPKMETFSPDQPNGAIVKSKNKDNPNILYYTPEPVDNDRLGQSARPAG